jgi:DNA processing protein
VNSRLWDEVGTRGLLLSEWPLGTNPDAFRFPLRNRIIAALAEVVVVVESREKGGSLITAVEAGERDVRVMAVPGSVRNRAAAGTNRLLADGADPVTDAGDVLVALGLDTRRAPRLEFDPRPAPRGLESTVLDRCRVEAATLDDLVVALDLPIGEVAMALARLERTGWVREATGWFEAVGSWSDLA